MLTVACVLRSGPEYRVEHVVALRHGIQRNLRVPHQFVCLTDIPEQVAAVGIDPIPLRHNWPGWWSKIELFRPGIFGGPVFYCDLDSIIVGPIDDLVLGHEFTMLRNFWSHRRIGSGLMAWNVDLSSIYRDFVAEAPVAIEEYRTTERWGDQGFIIHHTPLRPDLWQVLFPGRVVSYKRNFIADRGIPKGASIICYHGRPRPWCTPLWKEYLCKS